MRYDIVILPTFAQVETWRKRLADSQEPESFGQVVSTFDAWIADLWELHGDGRALVDAEQRQMLAHKAVLESAGDDYSRGMVQVAVECMSEAAGLECFEQALASAGEGLDVEGLSNLEHRFCRILSDYERELKKHGLVERGQAAMALAEKGGEVFPQPLDVLMPDAPPLTWIQERFFSRCDQLRVSVREAAGNYGVSRAPEGVEVRFACPSGALAEPGIVADIVEGLEGDAVITCIDPLSLFDRLTNRLCARRSISVQANKPFSQTDFGRTYLSCYRSVHDPWDPARLADVLKSAFAGVSQADAEAYDERLRADRIVQREVALQEVRAASEPFSQLEELVSDPDADVLIGAFEQRVQAESSHSDSWRAEQRAAMAVLKKMMAAARMAGVGIEACVQALEHAVVPIAVRGGAQGAFRVLVTTTANAAQLPPESCALLIAADLTSEHYPVADKDDAASMFLLRLGLARRDTSLSRARREFCALLGLPRKRLVVVRPLGDANADETYPAAVLEEFVDAYRCDSSSVDDIDNPYRLPEELLDGLRLRGEELLFANAQAGATDCEQRVWEEADRLPFYHVSDNQRGQVMPPRRDCNGVLTRKACPSPSQVEAYLECPYRWFAERRLHIEELEEGFGPLERGTFAHAALEEFYRRFQAGGYDKVNEGSLAAARDCMRGVCREVELRQYSEDPMSGRYVAVNELERREVAALCEQLVSYLDLEARMLPSFHPAYLEYEIDASNAVDYAGYSLVGKVDRIDVDGAGNAVIIDYKGSVNGEHEIAGKNWAHAGKVQTRMYARAVERALGLRVVGALYVSYGRKPALAGAYDPRVLEAAHLPGMKHDNCSCGTDDEAVDRLSDDFAFSKLSFSRMLDETEALAGEAISRMEAGCISPDSAYDGACEFCTVLACPKRK